LAAYWINSFNNVLVQTSGWRKGLEVTRDAQAVFSRGLKVLENKGSAEAEKIMAYSKRMILPNLDTEMARSRLHGEQWEEAFDLLVRTLLLNPYYPLDSAEAFHDF
jgi:hypothetical protein